MREMPRPHQEEPNEEPPKKGFFRKLTEHPLAKPLIVAAALHLPINEQVENAIENVAHEVAETLKAPWDRAHMVIEPQSQAQKDAVTARVTERESHIDQAARLAYKADAEKKLEAGKAPSFKRMQFDLDRLNGVPPAEVTAAEQKADALIGKYAAEAGDDLDADKLKRISVEMYGPDDSYRWDQASTSSYFNTGNRNCVAISRAQSIVIEGVLAHLPPEKRVHWRQTTQLVKQHEIAGIEHVGDDGQRDELYLLEGKATHTWNGSENEPGTATLSMDAVKKALVSAAPIEIRAAGAPAEIKDSPNFDFVSDEPTSLNIRIEGKLKGAESNVQEAKRQGIEPRSMTAAEIAAQAAQEKRLEDKTIEIELLDDPGPSAARDRLKDGMRIGGIYKDTEDSAVEFMKNAVDVRDFASPSKETVAALDESVDASTGRWKPKRIYYGTMESWSGDAIRQALQNDIPTLSLQMKKDGRISKNVLIEYAEASKEGRVKPTTVKIESDEGGMKFDEYVIDPQDLHELLSGSASVIDIADLSLGEEANRLAVFDVIKSMPASKTVIMPFNEFEPRDAGLLLEMQGVIVIPCNNYSLMIGARPDLLDNGHLYFDETAPSEDLDSLRLVIEGLSPHHPLLKHVEKLLKSRQTAHPPLD